METNASMPAEMGGHAAGEGAQEHRREEFEGLQAQARAENRGLWAACPENPCN